MIPEEKLDQIRARFEFLEARLNAGAAVADLPALSREYAELKPVVAAIDRWRGLAREEAEAERLLADPEMRALAQEEIERLRAALPEAERAVQLALLPRDEADERSAILEIRAGTGGEEAALFAADLARMYQRLAGGARLALGGGGGGADRARRLSGARGGDLGEGRLRGAEVRDRACTGCSGCRRPRASGRIHTSAATVAVLPEAEEVDVEIPAQDLRIDTMRSSGAGGQHVNTTDSAVRITHLPTGIVVTSSEKSQHQNRARAMEVLRARLYDMERQRRDAERAADRKGQVGSGDRSERIRTYNFPQGRLTDHRIGLTLYRLDQVMQGDLGEVIEALTAADQAARLADLQGVSVRAALAAGTARLAAAGVPDPARDARRLMAEALGRRARPADAGAWPTPCRRRRRTASSGCSGSAPGRGRWRRSSGAGPSGGATSR